jgi:hypothetical protein
MPIEVEWEVRATRRELGATTGAEGSCGLKVLCSSFFTKVHLMTFSIMHIIRVAYPPALRVHCDVPDLHQHIVKDIELLAHHILDQVLLIGGASSGISLAWSQSLP